MTHIGIAALAEPRFGGTYQYTLSTVEALRRLPQHRYTIYTTARNRAYDHLGLPIIRLPGPAATSGHFAARLASGSHSGLFCEVEKVIAPIYTTYLLASCRPFVFTLHDLQEKHLPHLFTSAQRAWRHITNALLTRRAARIVCESRYVRDDIVRFFGIDTARIVVIAAPPVSAFSTHCTEELGLVQIRQRLNLPERYLLYPAQFYAHKNHGRLIEAFASVLPRHPECHLVLTGERRYEYERVLARIREHGLASRVLHVGQLDVDDLMVAYKLATAVIVPTLFESISIPIYEAFSLGVPVCSSNVVALPEQVGDAALLFDPSSVQSIAHGIETILDDGALRVALVERGKHRIESMTLDRYATQLNALLADI
jgi:glycosyltransferase involved in cell wall biosynthesis